MRRKFTALLIGIGLVALVAGLALWGASSALAEEGSPATPQATPAPMHPAYALLDANGQPVAQSGQPADLVRTCGQCHDTAFITSHATHKKAESIPGFEGMTQSCYLCHGTQPNNKARQEALSSGDAAWADSAVLLGTGILEKTDQGWQWNPDAFDAEGKLKPEYVTLHRPTNANCAQCHGVVHTDKNTPLVIEDLGTENWVTRTTGQVVSPQRIADSGMNIAGKENLTFAFDVHAERGVQCVDCHTSANGPSARRAETMPGYLTFEPRHPDPGEFLKRPDHTLTKTRCESCHDAEAAHKDWLPYLDLHMANVSCETCHVPQLYAPALESVDRTVVLPDGSTGKLTYRGLDEGVPAEAPADAAAHEALTVAHRVSGFVPAIIKEKDGKLAPVNLVTTFKWVYEKDGKTYTVSDADLKKAWMPNGQYAPEIIQALDANGDGQLSPDELVLDTQDKVDLIAGRLSALGLSNPHIVAEVAEYPIHHSVVDSRYALRDCRACHGKDSRILAAVELAPKAPAGAQPVSLLSDNGQVVAQDGQLVYRPEKTADLYLAGRDAIGWIDLIGLLLFFGTLLGVTGHGALRAYFAKKYPHHHHGPTKREYLYTAAERFWHWLQMAAIVTLLIVGLIIHKPDWFGGLSFRGMVFIHTVAGWILVINFILAIYYFLSIGYITQFIPKPKNFIQRALLQAQFYIRGIFLGEPHPFKKSYWDKLNPMQRMAYFGLLFGLLPIQMVTGVWLWAARIWPQAATLFGPTTLTWVAGIHTLDAWLIAAFVVGHVYLTTTGASVFEYIKAMITGWEEVEVEEAEAETEAA